MLLCIFVARSIFYKVKNYLSEENKNGGEKNEMY